MCVLHVEFSRKSMEGDGPGRRPAGVAEWVRDSNSDEKEFEKICYPCT